jgi:hypothetical protein
MNLPTGSKSISCNVALQTEVSDSDIVERAKADRLAQGDEAGERQEELEGESSLARWQKMKRRTKEERSRDGVADQSGLLKTGDKS